MDVVLNASLVLLGAYTLHQGFLLVSSDSDNAVAQSKDKKEYYRGKVIWITGASSGIGEALARHIAGANVDAKLVLTARNKDDLVRLAKELEGEHQCQVKVVAADLSILEELTVVVDRAEEAFGRIDVLVNNAGLSQRDTLCNSSFGVAERLINLDLLSCIALARECVIRLKNRGEKVGHIVNVSSLAGLIGVGVRTSYCAAKFGLRGFSDAARLEFLGEGLDIAVTTICPGYVQTNVSKNAATANNVSFGATDKNIAEGMDVARCAELMSRAISNRLDETWITKPDKTKLAIYAAQYIPTLFKFLMKRRARKTLREQVEKSK